MQNREINVRSPELKTIWREFQDNGVRARELTGSLNREQMWWRPAESRWSPGECLDHLLLAGQAYLQVIDEALEKARVKDLKSEGPPRRSLWGNALVHGVEPPARVKIPAPRSIRPRRPIDIESAEVEVNEGREGPLTRFLDLRWQIAERLEAADGVDLGRVRIRSPFVPLVRVNLHSALRIMTGHERRHLHQAENVLAHEKFPRAAAAAG